MCLEFPAQNRFIIAFPIICSHFSNITNDNNIDNDKYNDNDNYNTNDTDADNDTETIPTMKRYQ